MLDPANLPTSERNETIGVVVIPRELVGCRVDPVVHPVDERWTMAYAAAIGDYLPRYFDTARPGGVVAHPVFPVCVEWPAIVASHQASQALGVTSAEARSALHADHDLTIHRLVRPGDTLTTTIDVVGLVNKRPGAISTLRLTTVDAAGRAVSTTTQAGVYLGNPMAGNDFPDPNPPAPIVATERSGDPIEITVQLERGAAHTYTECARIWNPIHTDQSVARRAGLPDIILHGTANLAYGVSAVVEHRASGQPELVRRITGRFAAMVQLPSTLTVRIWSANTARAGQMTVPFEVLNGDGVPAVRDGLIVLGGSRSTVE